MYKIFVVEDSKPIMRNIINLLNSFDDRLEIVGTAFDGREALEKLDKITVNILLTDIRMPFLDGLGLISEVKKRMPWIHCVVISGYDDFEYAKQAITLGVSEYILKPVDAQELKGVLQTILTAVDSRIQLDIQRLFNESVVRELHRKIIGQSMPFRYFVFSLIRVGLLKCNAQTVNKKRIGNSLKEAGIIDKFWIIDTGCSGEMGVVFSLTQPDVTLLKSELDQVHEKLIKEIEQVNIIVSRPYIVEELLAIREIYSELTNTLSSLIIIGESRVFEFDTKLNMQLDSFNEEAVKVQKKMSLLFKEHQIKFLEKDLHNYFNKWEANHYPVIFVKRFLVIIFEELNVAYENKGANMLTDMNTKVDEFLANCTSFKEVYINTINYCMGYIRKFNHIKGNSKEELVLKIEDYLRSNIYGTVTLQDISIRFNISPSYINRLMKQKYQISPMDYYMKLKMEEAKKLLTSTKILIKDISESLGFNDQHYFSKVFKAYAGISPAKYRNDFLQLVKLNERNI